MIGFNGGLIGGVANARATSAVSAVGVWTLDEQRRAKLGNLWPAAGGPLWTPADITTELWLDAADASTVQVVSGAVAQWDDKSGNGRNAAQASPGLRPLLDAASVNGLDSITFNDVTPGQYIFTSYDLSASNTYMICCA